MSFEIQNQTQPKPDPNWTKAKRTGTSHKFSSNFLYVCRHLNIDKTSKLDSKIYKLYY